VGDREERGRTAVGVRHGRAKLTEADANEIWWLLREEWLSGAELARRFGGSPSIIYNVTAEEPGAPSDNRFLAILIRGHAL
jgi:hypothetical protein